jgi:UDPglucose--hexose-1-phosphate uridylyltransferase
MPKPSTTPPRSEIRIDYVHDRQVIIAPGRLRRPHDHNFTPAQPPPPVPPENDAFSPERLRKVRALLTVGGERHWRVKVVKNIFPVVSPDNPQAYGYQEVVVETPDYGVELASLPEEHMADILAVYGKRVRAIQQDKKIRYILVFKNNGGSAGASIDHAHSQIFASAYVPPHVVVRRKRAQEYRIMYNRDYYSDLLLREEQKSRWIASGKYVCALTPYASLYNYEAWIMPWRRVDNVSLLEPLEIKEMAHYLKLMLVKLNAAGLAYNYYMHQLVGDQGEHMYLRIAPRRDVWAGLELGSRLVVNTVTPEEAAEFYRSGFKTRDGSGRRSAGLTE